MKLAEQCSPLNSIQMQKQTHTEDKQQHIDDRYESVDKISGLLQISFDFS